MFEVGLDFQEELGEVFGHLAADRKKSGTIGCVLSEFSQGLPVSGSSGR